MWYLLASVNWKKKGKTDMPIKWSNLLSSHPETPQKSEYHEKNQLFGAFKSIKKNSHPTTWRNGRMSEKKRNKLPKTAIKRINENDLWISRFVVVFFSVSLWISLTIKISDCASPSPAPKNLFITIFCLALALVLLRSVYLLYWDKAETSTSRSAVADPK